MIEAVNLCKSFGGRPAIKGVSFRLEKGQILGFLGPNGAGKTTTMRILTCFMPPDSGTARVDGLDVFERSMDVRRRIGYLPESPPLYPDMIVRRYLEFVAKIRGIPSGVRRARVDEAVERCGLGDEDQRLIGNLSKGYRQRVGLAQAIIHDPPILILDEPTAGLDPEQIIEIRELIRSLSGDHTVILSTHILSEVTVTCSKVAIISYGEIVQEGSLEGLASKGEEHLQIRIRLSRGGADAGEALTQLPWTRTVRAAGDGTYLLEISREDRAREEIAALAVQRGWGLIEMTPLTRSLEEIYLEATRRLPGSEETGGLTSGFGGEGPPRDPAGKAAAAVAGGGRS